MAYLVTPLKLFDVVVEGEGVDLCLGDLLQVGVCHEFNEARIRCPERELARGTVAQHLERTQIWTINIHKQILVIPKIPNLYFKK